ncbi:MAG: UDP-N-acetylmuramate dehydrogenase [Phycisphaerales bacterium]|nr:UDP-N-acetylmuramate dehydrogenase [Phycisphaerales bacterium]
MTTLPTTASTPSVSPGPREPASLYDLVQFHAPIPTWFGVGGKADRYAEPPDEATLRDVLLAFAGHHVRVLGDGANLLVDDDGVDGVVVSLKRLSDVRVLRDGGAPGDTVIVRAGAGMALAQLITWAVRESLAGLEVLGGIPASVGGAAVMNAGGSFGCMADVVHQVHAVTSSGAALTIPASEVCFDYRQSGLDHLIVTAVEFKLTRLDRRDQPALRQKLLDVMAYKKDTQPLAEHSAGCVFRNPETPGAGRVSAGRLIDLAGCKGLTVGGATVSDRHANFIVAGPGCTARDILQLMEEVQRRVYREHGVRLEAEVRVWRRRG